jgi:hypothetical protein
MKSRTRSPALLTSSNALPRRDALARDADGASGILS